MKYPLAFAGGALLLAVILYELLIDGGVFDELREISDCREADAIPAGPFESAAELEQFAGEADPVELYQTGVQLYDQADNNSQKDIAIRLLQLAEDRAAPQLTLDEKAALLQEQDFAAMIAQQKRVNKAAERASWCASRRLTDIAAQYASPVFGTGAAGIAALRQTVFGDLWQR